MSILDYVLIIILGINTWGFVLVAYDKHQAQGKRWRIQERTLLGTAVAGGSAGVYLAMLLFRHKTKKPQFAVGIPVIIFVQCALLFFML